MPLHHRLHRIVILSVIVNLLPVFKNERPVRIEAVCLDSVFHVICASLVERSSLDIVGNTDSVSLIHGASTKRAGERGNIPDAVRVIHNYTYTSYFLPKPRLAPSESYTHTTATSLPLATSSSSLELVNGDLLDYGRPDAKAEVPSSMTTTHLLSCLTDIFAC